MERADDWTRGMWGRVGLAGALWLPVAWLTDPGSWIRLLALSAVFWAPLVWACGRWLRRINQIDRGGSGRSRSNGRSAPGRSAKAQQSVERRRAQRVLQWFGTLLDHPSAAVALVAFVLWVPLAWREAVWLVDDATSWTSLIGAIATDLGRHHVPSLYSTFPPYGPILQNAIPASAPTLFVGLGALAAVFRIPADVIYVAVTFGAMVAIGFGLIIGLRAFEVSARFQSIGAALAIGSSSVLGSIYGRGSFPELLGLSGVVLALGIVLATLRTGRFDRGLRCASVAAGMACVAHPITAVMGAVFGGILVIALASSRQLHPTVRSAGRAVGWIGGGIALNAWGLLPFAALGDKTDGALQLSQLTANDYYFFGESTRPPTVREMVDPLRTALLDGPLARLFVTIPFLLLVLCTVWALARPTWRQRALAVLPLSAIGLYLVLRSSLAFSLPLLRLNQYVTRPFVWAGLLAAVAIAVCADRFSPDRSSPDGSSPDGSRTDRSSTWMRVAVVAGIVLLSLEGAAALFQAVRSTQTAAQVGDLKRARSDDLLNHRARVSEVFLKGLYQQPLLDVDSCAPLRTKTEIAEATSRSSIPFEQACASEIKPDQFVETGAYTFSLPSSDFGPGEKLALPIATSTDAVRITGAKAIGSLYIVRRTDFQMLTTRESLMVVVADPAVPGKERPPITVGPRPMPSRWIGALVSLAAAVGLAVAALGLLSGKGPQWMRRLRRRSAGGVSIVLALVAVAVSGCSPSETGSITAAISKAADGTYERFIGGEGITEVSRIPFDTKPSAADRAGADALAKSAAETVRSLKLTSAAAATAAGFEPISSDNTHWVNQKNVDDGRSLDPTHPEFLVISGADSDETFSVDGLMFLAGKVGVHGPQPDGATFFWHRHTYSTERCFEGGFVMRIETAATDCVGDSVMSRTTPEMLHLWLVTNPYGRFASQMVHPDHVGHG